MENCHSLIHSSQATASPQCVVGIQTLHCQGPHQQEAGIRKWNWASNQGTLTGTWHPSGIPTAMLTASPGIRYFLYNQNLVFSVLAIRISKVRFIFYFWYKIKIKLLQTRNLLSQSIFWSFSFPSGLKFHVRHVVNTRMPGCPRASLLFC